MIESVKDCVAQKIWGRSTHDFVRYYLKYAKRKIVSILISFLVDIADFFT